MKQEVRKVGNCVSYFADNAADFRDLPNLARISDRHVERKHAPASERRQCTERFHVLNVLICELADDRISIFSLELVGHDVERDQSRPRGRCISVEKFWQTTCPAELFQAPLDKLRNKIVL